MDRMDLEVNSKNRPECSFLVQIQFRQNATWQGRIVWMEERKTIIFRSLLELMVLLEEALSEESIPDDGKMVEWNRNE